MSEHGLIRAMQQLGIDVFMFTESQNDAYKDIKPRDVIQIYRVFNALRDSGKDRGNEIKLTKLRDFPFFTDNDYQEIRKKSFFQSDLVNGREPKALGPRPSLLQNIGCFGGNADSSNLDIDTEEEAFG